MPSTIHGRGLFDSVNNAMIDPAYAVVISTYLKGLKTDTYDRLLVDAVFQKDDREGAANIFDAHGFMLVHSGLINGHIATCTVPVGVGPSADHDIEGNNEKLRRVPNGFHVRFAPERGGGADCDGTISWDFVLGAWSITLSDDNKTHECWKYWLAPDSVPLEVGTTAASRTVMHVRQYGGVCRWPYSSPEMLLILRADRFSVRKELISSTPCSCSIAAKITTTYLKELFDPLSSPEVPRAAWIGDVFRGGGAFSTKK